MKINNANFRAAREAFTERLGIGVNASRKQIADAAGLRSIQRIIDYETDPTAGASPLVVSAMAKLMKVNPKDLEATNG